MKFRFCGDLDCPDWVLAEIATISKISSIKIKSISQTVLQYYLQKKSIEETKLIQLANETKLELNDIKASITLLIFIYKHSASHNVNSEALNFELQQLGLPKEHARSICKNYEDYQVRLQEYLKNTSIKLNNLVDSSWSVDYIFGTNTLNKANEPLANLQLNLNSDGLSKSCNLTLNSDSLKLLIHGNWLFFQNLFRYKLKFKKYFQELKEARKIMKNFES